MSVTTAHRAGDPDGQPTDRRTIAVNPPVARAHGELAIARVLDRAPNRGDATAVEEFVAGVLRIAHNAAEALKQEGEARAIFHVAVSFASEFETRRDEFDREGFIYAATGL